MDARNMTREGPDSINLLVIGQENVGKTTIVKQLREIGANIFGWERDINANIWKSSHEQIRFMECNSFPFPSFRKLFIKSGDAFILTYAADDKSSFEYATSFIQEIRQIKGRDVPIIVAANKSDTEYPAVDREVVDTEIADNMECKHIEVCAVDGEGVKELFCCLLGYFGQSVLHQGDQNENEKEQRKEKTLAKRLSRFVIKKLSNRKSVS